MSRQRRTTPDIRRRYAYRLPQESILIVCEGKKTEPFYFDGLRRLLDLRRVELKIKGGITDPISIVGQALQQRKKRTKRALTVPIVTCYDAVWCVFDVEIPPRAHLARALAKAKKHGLKVALSNPCFEFWYLLHYKKTTALMQQPHHVLEALRTCYPGYTKNDPAVISRLFPLTEDAIQNAKLVLKEKGCGEDLTDCNPSTHVHRLVEHLFQISKHPPSIQ